MMIDVSGSFDSFKKGGWVSHQPELSLFYAPYKGVRWLMYNIKIAHN